MYAQNVLMKCTKVRKRKTKVTLFVGFLFSGCVGLFWVAWDALRVFIGAHEGLHKVVFRFKKGVVGFLLSLRSVLQVNFASEEQLPIQQLRNRRSNENDVESEKIA